MTSGAFRNVVYDLFVYKSNKYVHDLPLNSFERMICHKTQATCCRVPDKAFESFAIEILSSLRNLLFI